MLLFSFACIIALLAFLRLLCLLITFFACCLVLRAVLSSLSIGDKCRTQCAFRTKQNEKQKHVPHIGCEHAMVFGAISYPEYSVTTKSRHNNPTDWPDRQNDIGDYITSAKHTSTKIFLSSVCLRDMI